MTNFDAREEDTLLTSSVMHKSKYKCAKHRYGRSREPIRSDHHRNIKSRTFNRSNLKEVNIYRNYIPSEKAEDRKFSDISSEGGHSEDELHCAVARPLHDEVSEKHNRPDRSFHVDKTPSRSIYRSSADDPELLSTSSNSNKYTWYSPGYSKATFQKKQYSRLSNNLRVIAISKSSSTQERTKCNSRTETFTNGSGVLVIDMEKTTACNESPTRDTDNAKDVHSSKSESKYQGCNLNLEIGLGSSKKTEECKVAKSKDYINNQHRERAQYNDSVAQSTKDVRENKSVSSDAGDSSNRTEACRVQETKGSDSGFCDTKDVHESKSVSRYESCSVVNQSHVDNSTKKTENCQTNLPQKLSGKHQSPYFQLLEGFRKMYDYRGSRSVNCEKASASRNAQVNTTDNSMDGKKSSASRNTQVHTTDNSMDGTKSSASRNTQVHTTDNSMDGKKASASTEHSDNSIEERRNSRETKEIALEIKTKQETSQNANCDSLSKGITGHAAKVWKTLPRNDKVNSVAAREEREAALIAKGHEKLFPSKKRISHLNKHLPGDEISDSFWSAMPILPPNRDYTSIPVQPDAPQTTSKPNVELEYSARATEKPLSYNNTTDIVGNITKLMDAPLGTVCIANKATVSLIAKKPLPHTAVTEKQTKTFAPPTKKAAPLFKKTQKETLDIRRNIVSHSKKRAHVVSLRENEQKEVHNKGNEQRKIHGEQKERSNCQTVEETSEMHKDSTRKLLIKIPKRVPSVLGGPSKVDKKCAVKRKGYLRSLQSLFLGDKKRDIITEYKIPKLKKDSGKPPQKNGILSNTKVPPKETTVCAQKSFESISARRTEFTLKKKTAPISSSEESDSNINFNSLSRKKFKRRRLLSDEIVDDASNQHRPEQVKCPNIETISVYDIVKTRRDRRHFASVCSNNTNNAQETLGDKDVTLPTSKKRERLSSDSFDGDLGYSAGVSPCLSDSETDAEEIGHKSKTIRKRLRSDSSEDTTERTKWVPSPELSYDGSIDSEGLSTKCKQKAKRRVNRKSSFKPILESDKQSVVARGKTKLRCTKGGKKTRGDFSKVDSNSNGQVGVESSGNISQEDRWNGDKSDDEEIANSGTSLVPAEETVSCTRKKITKRKLKRAKLRKADNRKQQESVRCKYTDKEAIKYLTKGMVLTVRLVDCRKQNMKIPHSVCVVDAVNSTKESCNGNDSCAKNSEVVNEDSCAKNSEDVNENSCAKNSEVVNEDTCSKNSDGVKEDSCSKHDFSFDHEDSHTKTGTFDARSAISDNSSPLSSGCHSVKEKDLSQEARAPLAVNPAVLLSLDQSNSCVPDEDSSDEVIFVEEVQKNTRTLISQLGNGAAARKNGGNASDNFIEVIEIDDDECPLPEASLSMAVGHEQCASLPHTAVSSVSSSDFEHKEYPKFPQRVALSPISQTDAGEAYPTLPQCASSSSSQKNGIREHIDIPQHVLTSSVSQQVYPSPPHCVPSPVSQTSDVYANANIPQPLVSSISQTSARQIYPNLSCIPPVSQTRDKHEYANASIPQPVALSSISQTSTDRQVYPSLRQCALSPVSQTSNVHQPVIPQHVSSSISHTNAGHEYLGNPQRVTVSPALQVRVGHNEHEGIPQHSPASSSPPPTNFSQSDVPDEPAPDILLEACVETVDRIRKFDDDEQIARFSSLMYSLSKHERLDLLNSLNDLSRSSESVNGTLSRPLLNAQSQGDRTLTSTRVSCTSAGVQKDGNTQDALFNSSTPTSVQPVLPRRGSSEVVVSANASAPKIGMGRCIICQRLQPSFCSICNQNCCYKLSCMDKHSTLCHK